MLELWRIRAILAALPREPADTAGPSVASIAREVADLAAHESVAVRQFGIARDGTPLVALCLVPPDAAPVSAVVAVGVPHGGSPTGARSLLAFARRLAADPALRALLGVRWWLVPCLDPVGARENAAWWEAAPSLAGYARGLVPPPPDQRPDCGEPSSPEWRALRDLIAATGPERVCFLLDAPTGGCALFADADCWAGREGDLTRALDPLGLPLDNGGGYGPALAAPGRYPRRAAVVEEPDPYERLRAERMRPLGAGLMGLDTAPVGAVVTPLFVDYARRERDRTPASLTRRATIAEGVRLWREWFAFGRTALDLLEPYTAAQAASPAQRALRAALRGAEPILDAGRRWPDLIARPDDPATIAEVFAHGDAVRLARLAPLAALLGCLAALDPASSPALADLRERAQETQTRWIDELAASGQLRPLRQEHAVTAQLTALLLALP